MAPVSELLYRSLIGKLTPEEQARLDAWIAESPEHADMARRLNDSEWLLNYYRRRRMIDRSRPAADMRRRLAAMRNAALRRRVVRGAAAAAVVAGVVFGAVSLWNHSGTGSLSSGPVEPIEMADYEEFDAIHPGQVKALLRSSAGHTLTLAAVDTAMPASELIMSPAMPHAQVEELCLDVPRGGEFKIILEDSTEVWLNSESQLRYPETFAANERRVQVRGEAYFAVKSDPDRPFFVETDGQVIRVHGTRFNVRGYAEDDAVYTTLESGIISLARSDGQGGELYMLPGHQAVLDKDESTVSMKTVNPSVITSWRSGRFVFEEQPLLHIMRDLSRWYNFDYEFDDPALGNIVFMGSIPRYADFTTAIAILEKSGGITFTNENDRIIISKKKQ